MIVSPDHGHYPMQMPIRTLFKVSLRARGRHRKRSRRNEGVADESRAVGAEGQVVFGGVGTFLEVIFASLGAGTFIYVAALETGKHEFESSENQMQKCSAAAFGFAFMALLALWF